MSLLDVLFDRKPKTVTVTHGRLQIIIAQERTQEDQTPDYLPTLRKELLGALSKYVNVSLNDIHISQGERDDLDVLELNITLPEQKKV